MNEPNRIDIVAKIMTILQQNCADPVESMIAEAEAMLKVAKALRGMSPADARRYDAGSSEPRLVRPMRLRSEARRRAQANGLLPIRWYEHLADRLYWWWRNAVNGNPAR